MDRERVTAWITSGRLPERMAADLAAQIVGGQLAHLPGTQSLAAEWLASKTTAKRARRLLASEDIIRKDENGHYYIPG